MSLAGLINAYENSITAGVVLTWEQVQDVLSGETIKVEGADGWPLRISMKEED